MRESGGDKPSGKEGSGREEALVTAFFPQLEHTASHRILHLTHEKG
jgi:hypothetical protein